VLVVLSETRSGKSLTQSFQNDGLHGFAEGKLLSSGGEDAGVKLWQVATRREHATWKAHGDYLHSLEFAPDGQLLADSRDKTIKLWEICQWK
jgi:WD40 repeat protein